MNFNQVHPVEITGIKVYKGRINLA